MKELYKCEVCGHSATLPPPKPRYHHYCPCNPAAPFYMVNVRLSADSDKLIAGMLGGMKKQIRRKP